MKPLMVLGHRRSGTHLLYDTINANFDVEFATPNLTHSLIDGSYLEAFKGCHTLIYIVRDGRDTICANYRYYKKNEKRKLGYPGAIRGRSLSEFLRKGSYIVKGNVLPEECCPTILVQMENQVRFWVLHTMWTCKWTGVFYIRMEDLRYKPIETTIKIGEHFGWKLRSKKPKIIVKEGLGESGEGKKQFSSKDLEYFWNMPVQGTGITAGDRMIKLGYKK